MFQLRAHFLRDIPFQVVADFRHEVRTANHDATPGAPLTKWGAKASRSMRRARSRRALRAGTPMLSTAADSSVESCWISRTIKTARYLTGSFIMAPSTKLRISVLEYNCSGSSVQA